MSKPNQLISILFVYNNFNVIHLLRTSITHTLTHVDHIQPHQQFLAIEMETETNGIWGTCMCMLYGFGVASISMETDT